MAFIKLLVGGDVFTPAPLGQQDILLVGDRIAAIGKELDIPASMEVEKISVRGMKITPGFIDLHVHITGGGGEAGPASRLPEIDVSTVLAAGVTTLLGMLGTDAVTRSTETLLAKAQGLEQEGVTALILSGSYSFPELATITGSLQKDIALIPHIIGVGELAMSDHRSSHATFEEFVRVVSDARIGGLIGGKPGLVVLHMGGGDEGMGKIFRLVEETDIPITQLLPTHTTRTDTLWQEAVSFARLGGNVDITASPIDSTHGVSLTRALEKAMEDNVGLEQITVSSDANGSLPRFDANKKLIGMKMGEINTLVNAFRGLVHSNFLSVQDALGLFTSNPAQRMGLVGEKGVIAEGGCADILAFDSAWQVDSVFARGTLYVQDGKVIKGGYFADPS